MKYHPESVVCLCVYVRSEYTHNEKVVLWVLVTNVDYRRPNNWMGCQLVSPNKCLFCISVISLGVLARKFFGGEGLLIYLDDLYWRIQCIRKACNMPRTYSRFTLPVLRDLSPPAGRIEWKHWTPATLNNTYLQTKKGKYSLNEEDIFIRYYIYALDKCITPDDNTCVKQNM